MPYLRFTIRFTLTKKKFDNTQLTLQFFMPMQFFSLVLKQNE